MRVRFIDGAGTERIGERTENGVNAGSRTHDWDEITLLPPSDATKIVCVGLNYVDHAEEAGMEIPDRPLLFLKGPNALSAHGTTVSLPDRDHRIDYEAELAVVIGIQCSNVSAENAMDVVEGITCFNDLSDRSYQMHETIWVRGKAFDNAAPIGPGLVPPAAVPNDATMTLRVNGETKQETDRTKMIFSIPELIEEITDHMTLEAGDVIATGTPAGVGPLSDGDAVEIEIEGVGTLEHDIEFY